jgi:hypothetical protein
MDSKIDNYSHKLSEKFNVSYETIKESLENKIYKLQDQKKSINDPTKKAYRDLSKELIKAKGGNINLDFKKYLKYKNKYMQLKNKEN